MAITEGSPDGALSQLAFPDRSMEADALGESVLVDDKRVLEGVVNNLTNAGH